MALRGKLRVGSLVFPVALIVVTLLACKKKDEPPALPADDAAPAASVAPVATEQADAAAPPATSEEPKTTTVVPLHKDGGAKDAAADSGAKDSATTSTADYNSIQACCGAIDAESKKTGPNQNKYKSAAAVCGGIAQKVKTGQADAASARNLIRAQLAGVTVPSGC